MGRQRPQGATPSPGGKVPPQGAEEECGRQPESLGMVTDLTVGATIGRPLSAVVRLTDERRKAPTIKI